MVQSRKLWIMATGAAVLLMAATAGMWGQCGVKCGGAGQSCGQGGAVNAKCPGCSMAVDASKASDKETRMHKGQKVVFCAAVCAEKWDKMAEADKDAAVAKLKPIVNAKCPMTSNPIDPNQTGLFKGMKVGFCCGDCLGPWGKLSEAEKEAKLKKVLPIVNTACPVTGKTIDPAQTPENLTRLYSGCKIGFCCPMCPGAWDKLSD